MCRRISRSFARGLGLHARRNIVPIVVPVHRGNQHAPIQGARFFSRRMSAVSSFFSTQPDNSFGLARAAGPSASREPPPLADANLAFFFFTPATLLVFALFNHRLIARGSSIKGFTFRITAVSPQYYCSIKTTQHVQVGEYQWSVSTKLQSVISFVSS